MINGEAMDLMGHERHLKYAAYACPHKQGDWETLRLKPKEIAMHSRAISCLGRTLFITLRAVWRFTPDRSAAGEAWYWHVVISCRKPHKLEKGDLESAVGILLGDKITKKNTLYVKKEKERQHGFVKIGKKLEKCKVPEGM